MSKVVLIAGKNGIILAILEYLVKNATAKEWSHIITTLRSPFKTTVHDYRIGFIALDFSVAPNTVAEKMRSVCSSVTHAYFSFYIHKDDFTELNKANKALFGNFIDAFDNGRTKLRELHAADILALDRKVIRVLIS